MNHDLLHWIALTQVPGVGSVNAKILISYCGSPEEVFKKNKAKLMRIPGIGEVTAAAIASYTDFERAAHEVAFIQKHSIKALPYTHPEYPYRLKEAEDAPVIIYYLGNANLNAPKTLAVVGTRKASEHGKAFTERFIADLASSGCLIVSGMAYGIDICAHKAAVQNHLPTVGVLAHGLHTLYPSAHHNTAKKMKENGGLLTEFLSGQDADKENFPKRNRIVAAMCDATLVIETAQRGGAMITADLANGYNRDVFAVPGRVTDELSAGCNLLIKKNKAALIESAADFLFQMGWEQELAKERAHRKKALPVNLTIEEQTIVNLFSDTGKLGIDDICLKLKAEHGNMALTLLDMEFKGIIRSLPGKYYQLSNA